ncbi:hypothetical protein FOA43_003353 [Brettanomyces nanus]|uniref:Condensin complex subunit 2 n=1 Tax=Eeniella nana TaxID=13502 RepID=A0A875RW11_EENNA|nr:uncharacterized protein FOA43_003353 [Brettanomyces nanus]QPG75967.1 hypothetical protein FOA43_003353 [Brettanomyces nanus]
MNSSHKRRRLLDDPEQNGDGLDTSGDFILTDTNIGVHKMNFDEAIRMATDNKINSSNSWKYALIDYFHDMNLLRSKDGLSINFQKAGATLDGCMKIFSHRIDSVASDTGRLLSGLAQKSNSAELGEETEGNISVEDEESTKEDVAKRRRRAKKPRTTLKDDFETLKYKQYDRELAIDPLFKSALSEFDEGGAKSLLMNILKINSEGRIVFDETMTASKLEGAGVNSTEKSKESINKEAVGEVSSCAASVNAFLGKSQFDTDDLTVCSNLDALERVLGNIDLADDFVDSIIPTGKKDADDETMLNNDVPAYEPVGNNTSRAGLSPEDYVTDNGISEADADIDDGEEGFIGNVNEEVFGLLKKLDKQTNKTWTGRTNPSWKIDLFRKTMGQKLNDEIIKQEKSKDCKVIESEEIKLKPSKNSYPINFLNTEEGELSEKKIFRKGRRTTLPESSFNDYSSVTLPDDLQWSSKKLIQSFLKPDTHISIFRRVKWRSNDHSLLAEQELWADVYSKPNSEKDNDNDGGQHFFADVPQDENLDEHEVDEDEGILGDIDFNMQLSSSQNPCKYSSRPLNYARVSKKVDVRRLKDNMWQSAASNEKDDQIDVKLSDVMKDTLERYDGKQKKDMSTSFFFICMLHLANEHELEISSNTNHTDLKITGAIDNKSLLQNTT